MKGKNKNKKKKEGREGRNEERGERRNLTSYNKKIGQKNTELFYFGLGNQPESKCRLIAVTANKLKARHLAICTLSTSISPFKCTPKLTFHLENSFSSSYLLEIFGKCFQVRW